MKNLIYFLIIIIFSILFGCKENETLRNMERLKIEAEELKARLDTARAKIDSGKKGLDSLFYRIKKDSITIDSTIKKLTPFKK